MEVAVVKEKKCPTCIGLGRCADGSECPTCNGSGEIPSNQIIVQEPCYAYAGVD